MIIEEVTVLNNLIKGDKIQEITDILKIKDLLLLYNLNRHHNLVDKDSEE